MLLWPFNKYPGTDYETFNWEWVLKTVKEWVATMQTFKNSITAAWEAMQEAWSDYQEDLNDQWADYQEDLNDQWADYQEDLNDQWQEFIDDTYKDQITEILEDHPEWVTTVMDGALTEPKLNTSLSNLLVKNVDTVSDMVASTDLRTGDMVHTRGYYAVEDGGDAFYLIVNTQPTGIWYESLSNNLYAAMLYNDPGVVDVRKHGVKSDGQTDDSTILQNIINFYATLNKKFFLFTGVTYLANSVDFSVIGNDINIKGVGTAESQIKLGSGATLLMERNVATYNIRVKQIALKGSGDAPLIRIDHYANVYFNTVSFEDGAATGFVVARNTSLLFFNDCNLDGYGQLYSGNTKPVFIDFYSAFISITACNIYHLAAVVHNHQEFAVNLQSNWIEDCDKIVELHANTAATTYANSMVSANQNYFLKVNGEFYLIYSDSTNNNMTNQSLELLGNKFFLYNISNTYLTYIVAAYPSFNLADTDYHIKELFDHAQVPGVYYRTFGYRTNEHGPKAIGDTLGARYICLSETFSESTNIIYAAGNYIYYKDGNGTVHQISMS